MSKSKSNKTEIEVFTSEQLEALPDNVKKDISFLEESLPAKELKHMNPLVNELIKIQKLLDLKYTVDEEGKPVPEVIKSYKQAKKEIIAFKKKTAETKKAIKKPLDLIGKKVISIEKTLIELADKITEDLKIEFSDYEKAERARLDELARKRNAKELEVIENLTSTNNQQNKEIQKINIINHIKYDILEHLKSRLSSVDSLNEQGLLQLIKELKHISFRREDLLNNHQESIDAGIITIDEFNYAFNFMDAERNNSIKFIQSKLDLLEKKQSPITFENFLTPEVPTEHLKHPSLIAKEAITSLENLKSNIVQQNNKVEHILLSEEESAARKKVYRIVVLIDKIIEDFNK